MTDQGTRQKREKTNISIGHLQKVLSLLVDNTLLRRHLTHLVKQERHTDMRRLQELRHPDTDHGWLHQINYASGTVLEESDYAMAVQHRLGCAVIAEPNTCRLCGGCLDVQLSHAICCAQAEATRGHYQI
eukprot:9781889-Karenia_brevis.AAC.1